MHVINGAGVLTLVAVTGAAAGPITPHAQSRSVGGSVAITQCSGQDDDGVEAKGFEAFQALAQAAVQCESASAIARGAQLSSINDVRLAARGSAASIAQTEAPERISAIGTSDFEVTFSVEHGCEFDLTGRLAADGGGDPLLLAGAAVRLFDGEGNLVFERDVEPQSNGNRREREVDDHGTLDAGVYRLRAFAGTVIDKETPSGRRADAEFDLEFVVQVPCPADLNEDGRVGFADLVLILSVWGPCEGTEDECLGDLDGNGEVDFGDLVEVLSVWGPCR